jgi:pyridoxamine 5'-phosphate oxidase
MSPHTELLPQPLPGDPFPLLEQWMAEAWQRRTQPNPNAMVLATSDGAAGLSARVVLCKQIAAHPGYLVFYTNYRSLKGRQIQRNPRAAAVIHWDALHRQVRVEGPVVEASPADSDAYFASRPWQSRLGAWASAQSEPVASREHMREALLVMAEHFDTPPPDHRGPEDDAEIAIPRPAHWGGYQLWVEKLELWVEGEARIHDRARWSRTLRPVAAGAGAGAFDPGPWIATRLQP